MEGTVSQTASASRDGSRGDLYGPGGGGGLVDGGPVALQALYPNGNGVSVQLTGPLYPSVGGMIVHMTCAN